MPHADWLIENVRIATMQCGDGEPYGAVEDGILAVHDGHIAWVGPRIGAPRFPRVPCIDGRGGWLTPGLIDCHTHLVYAGTRTRDFELRQQGWSYADIAHSGGGILHTVEATRAASEAELLHAALDRLMHLFEEGVTTVEIKSGYGLDLETELRILRTVAALKECLPVTICPTYLGAHAVPPEFAGRPDEYIDYICAQVLPRIADAELATAVDVYCETVGFTQAQCRRVLETAQFLGFAVKGHVEQLSRSGGAALLAEFEALSADHLEYLAAEDAALLRRHNVVAVLLPAAAYFLGESRRPPIAQLRAAGTRMAVASDCNPGTAPVASLLTAMNLACVRFGLSPEESLAGVTCHAARALGMQQHKGMLEEGFDADVLLWEIDHPAALSVTINMVHPHTIWIGGKDVSVR